MTRSLMLAGALALAIPSLALAQPTPAPADPSNPAAAPLSPTLDAANQPARGDDSALVRESGAAPDDAETEADRQAREEAAKPKQTRTVRMGERTMAAGELPRR